MKFKDKKVLLVGLAKTGVSAIKKLVNLGSIVTVNDIKNKEQLSEVLSDLKELKNVDYVLGTHLDDVSNIDLAVVSPGVPLDLPFIKKLYNEKIEVIGEVELSFRLSKNPTFIGITGTNGKTTTTSLTGEIYKACGRDTYVVGNIGTPVIDVVDIADENSFLITELSSFQLESVSSFRPRVSAILNITEDHLNRHHTMENYIDAKANIFKNQEKEDYTILNYDDEMVRNLKDRCNSNVIYFSRKVQLDQGIFVDENGDIIIKLNNESIKLMNKSEISIPGNHNLENALAAIGMSIVLGVELDVIKKVLKTFGGVEHRLEFVKEINNIMFVNDSKGTNPDSTIKAIEAYDRPIILIAGGMDKYSDFTDMIKSFNGGVKSLVLLGETAEKIEKTANKEGFFDCYRVNNMKEAVAKAYSLAVSGDVVLLSPACASWDMYPNFETRGMDFKNNVESL
jgi:UDP-N-acetylmuramoylalanine--D-glutamate ligase